MIGTVPTADEWLRMRSVMIASRFRTPVPIVNLAEYFQSRVKTLDVICHPFSFNVERGSTRERFVDGVGVNHQQRSYTSTISEGVLYGVSCLQTIRWAWKTNGIPIDLYIGLGVLEAATGILLRMSGKVRHVVFYSIDFVPQRFPGRLFQSIYARVERWVVHRSDIVWNLSSRMVGARERFRGVSVTCRAKQLVLPIGTVMREPVIDFDHAHPYELCYVGHLRAGQGVEMLLRVFQNVIQKVSEARLVIMGGGEKEQELRALAEKLGLQNTVQFSGFVKEEEDVLRVVSQAWLAIAFYPDDGTTFTQYTDPGKIKTYLSCAVPVAMTPIAEIAEDIEQFQWGTVIPWDASKATECLVTLLQDTNRLRIYRQNACLRREYYEWNKLFTRVIQQSIEKGL